MAGGWQARVEALTMVTEKLEAAHDETGRFMLGATPDRVIRGYRSRVRANKKRLSK